MQFFNREGYDRMKILIVGGVAGGASAAARLRRLSESAEIVMFERGEYISFANCGLPYYIGGEIKDKKLLTLQTPKSFNDRFNVDIRTMSEVVSVNPEAKTVTVVDLEKNEKYEESYDKLILSPGASPIRPNIDGIDREGVFTLRNIPDTYRIKRYIEEKKPRSALVVGGGYIGVEMAENLKNAGLDVTVVEMSDHLIAPLDFDMAADVHGYMKENGIGLVLGSALKKIERGDRLRAVMENGCIDTDMIIMSVGVRPETSIIKETSIALSPKGSIITDGGMQTNYPDIYAVGDAVQAEDFVTKSPAFIPLAGPANRQGRIAADNIFGVENVYKGTQGSAVVKIFDMTVATTGVNEKTAAANGIDYDKTYIYSASHAGYYPGSTNMSIKVLWNRENQKILGAQIVGFDGVDKRMDVLATAIRFGARVTDLKDLELCYAPPFGSAKDPVNMIGFVAENVIDKRFKQFFWHDVDDLPRDGSITLLDVRTKYETSSGMIDGFMNIPLDSLRDNIHKIPTGKPVYINCHSGLRSYIACRILVGYGFDCYSLAGGYRLYESVMEAKTVENYNCLICK